MSIHVEITKQQLAGKLWRLLPVLDEPAKRHVYASKEVYELLREPLGGTDWDERRAQAVADVDWFITGHRVDVRFSASRNVKARFAQLEPPEDGVWEFRVRNPTPGIRIFGSFADTDIFVALTWRRKENLLDPDGTENPLRYRHAIAQCKTTWLELLGLHVPKSGADIHDYISRKATVLS